MSRVAASMERLEIATIPREHIRFADYNPRTIDDESRERLSANLDEFGCVEPLVWNRRTGHVVSGHQRLRHMDKVEGRRDYAVTVSVVDLDERAEKRLNVLMNNPRAQGSFDPAALLALVNQGISLEEMALTSVDIGALQSASLEELANDDDEDDDGNDEDDEEEEFQGIYALREDVIFPSSNHWGIPDLLPGKLSDVIPDHTHGGKVSPNGLYVYRTVKLTPEMADGTLAFYVEDYRFERVWADAVGFVEQMKALGWKRMVSPDFSLWRDAPRALQVCNIYRNRWCARYWQEAGFDIIPSLNWSDLESHEWCNAGIPVGAPVVSVQCRTTTSRKGREFFLTGICRAIEIVKPESVLIYGGTQHQSWLDGNLPTGPNYVSLPAYTQARKERL